MQMQMQAALCPQTTERPAVEASTAACMNEKASPTAKIRVEELEEMVLQVQLPHQLVCWQLWLMQMWEVACRTVSMASPKPFSQKHKAPAMSTFLRGTGMQCSADFATKSTQCSAASGRSEHHSTLILCKDPWFEYPGSFQRSSAGRHDSSEVNNVASLHFSWHAVDLRVYVTQQSNM